MIENHGESRGSGEESRGISPESHKLSLGGSNPPFSTRNLAKVPSLCGGSTPLGVTHRRRSGDADIST